MTYMTFLSHLRYMVVLVGNSILIVGNSILIMGNGILTMGNSILLIILP